tara:strand:- start:1857 stop:2870 length:1014 start_codon:yes stop_codon:yes gene_type:complete
MIHIDGIIFHLQTAGGISVYFKELLKFIERESVLYEVGIYSKNGSNLKNSTFIDPLKFERYRSCHIPSTSKLFHSSYYRLPDRRDVPVVTTVHDFTYEKFIKGPRKWIHSWQKQHAILNSDAIICISENTAKDLLIYMPKVDEKKIHVIHNGVSSVFMPKACSDNVSSPFVLFVGARGEYKNFKMALQALSLNPGVNLLCVGGGSFTAQETSLISTYLDGRCEWAGFVEESQLNLLYNQAVCLLYPSLYEGFGIPVLEAMRAGCPVVAVNSSSIPEVAGSSAILVDNVNPTELSEAVSLLMSGNVRKGYIESGFKQANKFSWDNCFEKTLSLYKKLM